MTSQGEHRDDQVLDHLHAALAHLRDIENSGPTLVEMNLVAAIDLIEEVDAD